MAIHGTSDSVVTPESGRWSATYWAAVNGCSDTRAPVSGFSPCEGHTGCPSGLYSYYCPTSGGHGISPLSAKLTWDFLKKF
jgi:hypothetical protein